MVSYRSNKTTGSSLIGVQFSNNRLADSRCFEEASKCLQDLLALCCRCLLVQLMPCNAPRVLCSTEL